MNGTSNAIVNTLREARRNSTFVMQSHTPLSTFVTERDIPSDEPKLPNYSDTHWPFLYLDERMLWLLLRLSCLSPCFSRLHELVGSSCDASKHYPNSLKCELYINHAQEDVKLSPDGGKCGLPAEFILEFMQDGRTPDRSPLTCLSNGPAQVYSNPYPSLNGSSQPPPAQTCHYS